jgi:hypothetical protein
MARVDLEASWTLPGNIEDLRDAVREFLRRKRIRFNAVSAGEIRFNLGSQLWTRLLGGWLVSAETLPMGGIIETKETDDGLRMWVLIEETLGLGFLDPLLKSKYKSFFDSWMNDLDRFIHKAMRAD